MENWNTYQENTANNHITDEMRRDAESYKKSCSPTIMKTLFSSNRYRLNIMSDGTFCVEKNEMEIINTKYFKIALERYYFYQTQSKEFNGLDMGILIDQIQ